MFGIHSVAEAEPVEKGIYDINRCHYQGPHELLVALLQ